MDEEISFGGERDSKHALLAKPHQMSKTKTRYQMLQIELYFRLSTNRVIKGKVHNVNIFSFFFIRFRGLLRINEKENDCWRMGLGMVACNRRSTLISRGDDAEPNV